MPCTYLTIECIGITHNIIIRMGKKKKKEGIDGCKKGNCIANHIIFIHFCCAN